MNHQKRPVALITGGASGIGLAMATAFTKDGAAVAIAGLAVFLANPVAASVTGSCIPIDGGYVAG